MNMKDYRQVWMEGSGEQIPSGWHVHHLIPRSEGGPDEYWNLICVSPEMHYDIHFVRGDYGACALLSDGIDRDGHYKAVVKYDLNGNRVGVYENCVEAGRSVGKGRQGISMCCRYLTKSYQNYQWFYESEVGDIDYIGPVVQKRRHNGNDTAKKTVLDTQTGVFYNSKREALRHALPHRSINSVGYVCEPRFV